MINFTGTASVTKIEEKSMDISKYAGNSRFLKAVDLGGKEAVVQIKGVYEETMQDGQTKLVMEFTGKDKMFVLNATNVKKLIELFGLREDEWVGRKICLYAVDTGQYGMGIRVKGVPAAYAMQSDPRQFTAPIDAAIDRAVEKASAPADFDDDIPW